MYENILNDLRSKGWSEKELQRLIRLFDKAGKEKTTAQRFLDKLVYWSALLLVIAGNLVFAVVLLPLLLGARDISIYLVVLIFGLFFGLLYRILIQDIEQISEKPVIIRSLFIPAIALIVMYIIARLGNQLAVYLNLPFPLETPLIVSLVYVLGFILPYFLYRM